jgi:hypothetical protein
VFDRRCLVQLGFILDFGNNDYFFSSKVRANQTKCDRPSIVNTPMAISDLFNILRVDVLASNDDEVRFPAYDKKLTVDGKNPDRQTNTIRP